MQEIKGKMESETRYLFGLERKTMPRDVVAKDNRVFFDLVQHLRRVPGKA